MLHELTIVARLSVGSCVVPFARGLARATIGTGSLAVDEGFRPRAADTTLHANRLKTVPAGADS